MNWEQPKRAEADYARLLFEITKKAFRIPLALRAEFLDLWSHQAAERMVLQRLHETARTWRAASREVMRGQYIYELLQRELDGPIGVRVNELIAENAKLIRSLPEKVALQAAQEQARRAQEGMRPEVDKNLLGHIAHWHSRLIARTETAKAQSALTKARAEELDLTYYVWRTSEDQRVRASHRKMAGVLVRWDDPPSPEALVGERNYGRYQAGSTFNCRCFSEPLLRLNQISWPHKLFDGNRIRFVTLAQFRNMNHYPEREQRIGIAA